MKRIVLIFMIFFCMQVAAVSEQLQGNSACDEALLSLLLLNEETQEPDPCMLQKSLTEVYSLEPAVDDEFGQKNELVGMVQDLKYDLQMQQIKNKYELISEIADINYFQQRKRSEHNAFLSCFAHGQKEKRSQQVSDLKELLLDAFKKEITSEFSVLLSESHKAMKEKVLELQKLPVIAPQVPVSVVQSAPKINKKQETKPVKIVKEVKIKTLKPEIAQAIDVTPKQVMKDALGESSAFVSKFKELTGYNRQQMLQLLDCEISLVEALFSGQRGYEVEKLMHKRNSILDSTNAIIHWMHSAILHKATTNNSSIAKLQSYSKQTGSNKLWSALYRNDRKAFLFGMKEVFDYYYGLLQETNFELAIDA